MTRLAITTFLSLLLLTKLNANAQESVSEKTVPQQLEIRYSSGFYSIKPVEGIPQSWVDRGGLDVLRYANHIKSLKLKRISPYQVLYPYFKVRNRSSLPPRHKWRSISETLKVVDQLCVMLDANIKPLVSTYRRPNPNRPQKVGAMFPRRVSSSLSVQFVGKSPREVAFAVKKLRLEGKFKGGLGTYRTFSVIDTRGTNVDW